MLVKSSFCSSNILTDRVVFVWISSLAFFFFSILLTNFFFIPPDYILRIQECNSWHCSCSWTSYNTWHCSSILWRTLPPWASVMLQSLGSPSAFLSFFFCWRPHWDPCLPSLPLALTSHHELPLLNTCYILGAKLGSFQWSFYFLLSYYYPHLTYMEPRLWEVN